jgi:hypothetical protein
MKGFGETIFSYTREMAITDGVLINISEVAKDAGFKVPVAVTDALYNGYLVPDETPRNKGQDTTGRIWDMLILLNLKAKGCKENIVLFSVRMVMKDGPQFIEMKSMIGPGDNGEPVITIMLPHED